MTLHDNAYAAFMLDYATGRLSPAERLAADLHAALSAEGGRVAHMFDAAGGRLLEDLPEAAFVGRPDDHRVDERVEDAVHRETRRVALVDQCLRGDLEGLAWKRDIFGVRFVATSVDNLRLLRLDPRQRAPQHGHSRRDVTVVLQGAFADEFGVYERGDLAFAEPGMRHEPRAIGDRPCICLIATEEPNGWRQAFSRRLFGRSATARNAH